MDLDTSETKIYGGIWESQRSRKKLADTQKNTNQE